MARLERLEHVLDRDLETFGDLGGRRVTAELLRELGDRSVDAHRRLAEAARQAHGPDVIAKMPAQLAKDRRRRVGDKGPAPVGIESVDRLQQAEVGDLQQVVEGLAVGAIASRQRARQRREAPDELLAQLWRATLRVAPQQSALSGTVQICAAACGTEGLRLHG